MFDTFQLLCVGAAAVIDTVLLVSLLEKRNWGYVMLPVVALVAGAWLWHAGTFAHLLLSGMAGPWGMRLHLAAVAVMVVGLLMMPSAMLHGIWRIARSGLGPQDRFDARYLLAYLPLFAAVPVVVVAASYLNADPAGSFLRLTLPMAGPYLAWLAAVNVAAAAGFLRMRAWVDRPQTRRFFTQMAATLLALTLFHGFVFLVALRAWPAAERALGLAVVMSPVVPALLFAYYVLRFNFMDLMLERTIVYGAV